ncbi:hypothetical protein [Bifidobacterium crudilactis]|uniref:hypothetical protein n=1 Tax=Bifidobacterium crudilactis TaxID=327277 RepID=UPI00264875BA|nr:hypothetical protein [Bifidobacterium crudilactis]MDN6209203.1 hypothetical protein [Bifidobacterium crudilactis]
MTNTYYDDFKTLTLEKMAASIEDMTYAYHQTRIPKTHYKKMLSTTIEETLEASVEINLIQPYVNIIKQMIGENPKSFFKALLCVETKTSLTSIRTSEWQALDDMWKRFTSPDNPNKGHYLPLETIETYKSLAKTGMDRLAHEIDNHEEDKK